MVGQTAGPALIDHALERHLHFGEEAAVRAIGGYLRWRVAARGLGGPANDTPALSGDGVEDVERPELVARFGALVRAEDGGSEVRVVLWASWAEFAVWSRQAHLDILHGEIRHGLDARRRQLPRFDEVAEALVEGLRASSV